MKIGVYLKTQRENRELSLGQVEAISGVSKSYLSKLERGERSDPSPEILRKLSSVYNVPYEELMEVAGFIDSSFIKGEIEKIPVLGLVKAGLPSEAIEDVIDWEEIPRDWLRGGKEYFALEISGDSMTPRMEEGDVIIVQKQQWCNSGDIMVVRVNGEEATVKKVIKQESGIMLIAFNNDYEPVFYSHKQMQDLPVEYLGKVVELRGKF